MAKVTFKIWRGEAQTGGFEDLVEATSVAVVPSSTHSGSAVLTTWKWMSIVSPRCASAIAEHSMCQPGRPRPHGLSQPMTSSLLGFHSTKSAASRL